MDDTNQLIEQRKTKLAALRAKGVNPFMNKFTPGIGCGEARAKFESGEFAEGAPVAIAGRITAHRDMGKSQFMDLKDVSGRVQIYAQKQALGDDGFDTFKHLDLADFVGVTGTMFRTRTGEPSVKVDSFTVLAKALRPPPGQWHGLEDTETRYRQRYLDLIANDEVKSTFLKRSQIIREIRNYLHNRGYVEVETPMMQAIPGGAAAQPFVTHHNALGCNFYLRIALELYLKRLLVGGVDKVFEIGRNFRNEGLSRKHNPEFTMLEAYEAFGDYESMMNLVQGMICHVAEKLGGSLVVMRNCNPELREAFRSVIVSACTYFDLMESSIETISKPRIESELRPVYSPLLHEIDESYLKGVGHEPYWDLATRSLQTIEQLVSILDAFHNMNAPFFSVPPLELNEARINLINAVNRVKFFQAKQTIDLTPNWRRARYKDLVREVAGQDWFDVSPEERRRRATEDLKLAGDIAAGYEDFEVTGAVFEKLVEPTLIQPTFVTHLPKELVPLAKLSPDDPSTVEVFECCINGQEISPGYSEQNDPIAQRETLEHQAGGEQQKLDDDFITALEHGMPPAGGIGIGIDRLCMMLLGQESIRDVILFPQLKPK
ncbi:MAG: lysine--tRNA ligase [Verrucomicrobiae bacterium]|nr:lysine--tRNA ligase [Verrucomicrobiae bacterium]